MGWVFIAARDFLFSLAYCSLLMRDSHSVRLNYAVNMVYTGTPVSIVAVAAAVFLPFEVVTFYLYLSVLLPLSLSENS